MNWPDTDDADFKRYFPTNTLVTGYDIIFFWVSRMMFQSLKFTGKSPFNDVVIHGLIRDEQGRKMSKSLGNGIDPMEVIEKYGADALRWFLMTGSTPGQDTRFSYDKMDAAWNFINKIWNASRFVIMNLEEDAVPARKPDTTKFDLSDRWIFSRLNQTIADVIRLSDSFEFGESGRIVYNFIWNDFCDWYIEMSKVVLNGTDEEAKSNKQANLIYVLDQILRLVHPTMPFVTEKLWLSMPHEGSSLTVAAYPEVDANYQDDAAEKEMNFLIELIKAVRNIRAEANAPMSNSIDLLIQVDSNKEAAIIEHNTDYLANFVHPKNLKVATEIEAPKLAKNAVVKGAQVFVPLEELVDLGEEIEKLQRDQAKLKAEIARIDKKLGNAGFVSKAPAAVVDEQKTKRADYESQLEAVDARIADLKDNQ